MAVVKNLMVRCGADFSALNRATNQSKKSITQMQTSVSASTAKMKSAFASIGKAAVAAFSVVKLIQFGKESIELASDLQEVQNVVDTAFGNMAGKCEEFAKTSIEQFGMSALSAKRTASTYMSMASSLGLTSEEASNMSISLAGLTGDVASFYNISQDAAGTKLKSVFTGETESLKELGVVMTQANLDAFAMKNGFGKITKEMSQAEKVQLRYAFVTDALSMAQGDFAKTSSSWANQTRVLAERWNELKSIIGDLLIRVLKPCVQVLNRIVQAAITAGNAIKAAFGIKAEASAGAISTSVEELSDSYDSAADSAKALKKATMGFDEMQILSSGKSDAGQNSVLQSTASSESAPTADTSANVQSVNALHGAFEKLKSALNSEPVQAFVDSVKSCANSLWQYWSTLGKNLYDNTVVTWGNIKSNVGLVLTSLTALWTTFWTDLQAGINTWGQPIITGISRVFNSVWTDAVDPYLQITSQAWADFSGILVELWNEHGQPLINNIGEFVTKIVALFQSIWDNILEPIVTPFLQMLSNTWEKYLKPLVKTVGDFVLSLVNGALEIYNKFISPIVMWIAERLKPTFEFIGNIISTVMGYIIGVISSVINGIVGFFTGLIDFVVGVFTGNWKKAWDGIKQAFSSVWDAIKGVAQAAWDLIKGVFSSVKTFFVSKWNDIKNVFSSVGTWFSNIFTKAWDGIKNAFSKVKGFFSDIWKSIKETFSKVGTTIADAVSGTVKKAINAVLSTAVKIINGFISAINTAIGLINAIPGVDIKELKKMEVPKLAKGGIVDKATPFIAGEAGREVVMPLENNTGWIDQLADKINARGKTPSKLVLKIGERTLGEVVLHSLNTLAMDRGGLDLVMG